MPSATPCKTFLSPSPMRSFFEELKHQTQMNCIQIQCDNARRPAFCFHKYDCSCHGQGLLSRKNNSMPDMKSRGNGKRDNKHDHSRSHSSKTKLKRPTSMPNIRSATKSNKTDHLVSRWTGGECDSRPILNAFWLDDDLSTCAGALSPKSPTTCVRQIQEFPPHRIPLHQQHRLPDYTMALDLVRQKYTTSTDGTCTSTTSTMMMPREGKGKRSSYRPQKRGQSLKCEESLIPPVRRQSIEEDDDLSDGGAAGVVLRMALPLTVGNISP